MPTIIDFHVHAFPDRIGAFLGKIPPGRVSRILSAERIGGLRRQARSWLKPVSSSLHQAQTMLRYLPEPARRTLDQMSGLAPLPGLIVESTPADLIEVMDAAQVDKAVVIAHPPLIPNEFILELSAGNSRLICAVLVPSGTARPGVRLKKLVGQGARLLKIHPAADGEGVDSPRYKALLAAAADVGIPVILHTGCLHSHVLYKDPEQGHAQRFAPWFAAYPKTQFILAHMNFHEPNVALDLCEEYANVHVDTSWQPSEVIGEAVRRIGSDRVLFGTDWPFVGQNLSIGISRVRECVEGGLITSADADRVLGENAMRLLGLNENPRK